MLFGIRKRTLSAMIIKSRHFRPRWCGRGAAMTGPLYCWRWPPICKSTDLNTGLHLWGQRWLALTDSVRAVRACGSVDNDNIRTKTISCRAWMPQGAPVFFSSSST